MNDKKIRVILVEDHDLFRQYYSKFVENVKGCEVIATAKCGKEAIDVIKTVPDDLILLDWRLPDLCGLEVLMEAKKISSAKVLVFTMSDNKEIVPQALEAGADGICRKDIGVKLMETAITETLVGETPVYF